MEDTPYLIGIDLGTTNISVAYVKRTLKRSRHKVKIFEIRQAVTENEIDAKVCLPSFHYTFSEYEKKCIGMPWENENDYVVGAFAKKQKIPTNLVHSAKSWLCHNHVDRRSGILPWGTQSSIQKISPIEASCRYLDFIKKCWNYYQAKNENEFFEKQSIILTVPAAFDQEARELTLEAAKKAGLDKVTLLEEPMSAFYSWIYSYQLKWPKRVKDDMLALVCDIGGGTTDFSLIQVKKEEENFSFRRIAVGNHLLLGGDNMDLTLAFQLEKETGVKLSHNQFLELVNLSREAKERLWASDNKDKEENFTIMGEGSSLIKGSRRFSLNQAFLEKHVTELFFPIVAWEEKYLSTASGLKKLGLPYESEPCITKHLRSFLQTHLPEGRKPDMVLFNGGVLTPKTIRDRICSQLQQWFEGRKAVVLTNNKLDLAVSIGAAYFHLVRRGEGIQVGGGIPRSYYLQIKEENKQNRGICILPFGSRQQQFFEVDQHSLEVIAKQPVTFSIYSSNSRKEDELGQIVNINTSEMIALPPLQTVIKVGKTAKKSRIPVHLQVQMNEIGLLDLRLVAQDSDRVWRLQFEIVKKRDTDEQAAKKKKLVKKIPFREQEVQKVLNETFCRNASPRALKGGLEELFQAKKDRWDLDLNRKLWDQFILHAKNRRKSEGHEERWLHFAGFCLRPGIGFPGDEWRIKKIMPFVQEKVGFQRNIQNWLEYWIMIRRIAAGLKSDDQLKTLRLFGEHLLGEGTKWRVKKSLRRHVKAAELTEMWRTAASLERLPQQLKQQLGDVIFRKIGNAEAKDYEYWSLGRIGARVLIYNQNPLSKEYILPWIESLLQIKDDNFYRISALAQLARKTGDRSVDIGVDLRSKVINHLEAYGDTPKVASLLAGVETISVLDEKIQKHYYGDSLPTGIVLRS